VSKAVSKVLIAPTFSNLGSFEAKGDTLEKHGVKSVGLNKIYPGDPTFFSELGL